ncbi:AMP-binding enzyme [Nocardioides aequoreus]|uniref:AMP-binding enzyme n=1 Tax=Nocardioides aequoreus TaxID=397278 RepID=UPI000A9D7F71|nr:AMP-binding protein [Nocardioides aequoreus]
MSQPDASLRPVAGTPSQVRTLLEAWESADVEPKPLVVATSGSTGRPKRVVLSRRAMRASADATHARLGGPGTWELDLPPTYVAGLQVLYRTLRGGGGDRRYTSLVPTQLVRAVRERDPGPAAYDAVLVGGGPLDAGVRAEAEAGGVRVVQTYGMSETCGGCVYDGVPLDGVEVRVRDGEVQLRGPVLFDGYEGEPERTAAAYDEGWLRTDDLGEVVDGRLRVTGRRDDVVLSGGLNVPATAVARMLATHPAVSEVVVLGVPDEEWGERVVAFCVADGVPEAELAATVAPREWRPKQWVRLDAVPLLPNGKPDRAALRALA